MAKVSVVTASYNYQDYIKETIESVLAQTFDDWEMIIVDDGSKDNSVNVIKSYCEKDKRIKLYQHENGINKGLAETVRLGIDKTTTDWIIFLESDDTITPNYIEEKLKVIEEYPDIKFIFNDVSMFGDKKIIYKYEKMYFSKTRVLLNEIKYPAKIPQLFTDLNIIPTFSAVMLHKSILYNLCWDSPLKGSLDYFLWSQLAPIHDFYYLNIKLTNWRMSKNSYINREKPPAYDSMLYAFKVHKYLNNGILDFKDFEYFINMYENLSRKYIKYKKFFLIFLIICVVQTIITLILIYMFLTL